MNWKAIAIGFATTLLIGLVIQLVYILIASLIAAYSTSLPLIAPYKEAIWMGGALFSFAIAMLIGGAITTSIAGTRQLLNPLIACTLASVVSLSTSLSYSDPTWMSLVFLLLSASFSVLGGLVIIHRQDSRLQTCSKSSTRI